MCPVEEKKNVAVALHLALEELWLTLPGLGRIPAETLALPACLPARVLQGPMFVRSNIHAAAATAGVHCICSVTRARPSGSDASWKRLNRQLIDSNTRPPNLIRGRRYTNADEGVRICLLSARSA